MAAILGSATGPWLAEHLSLPGTGGKQASSSAAHPVSLTPAGAAQMNFVR
jgi:hypothetical protein